MRTTMKTALICLLSVSMFMACKKGDKGDTGPQGPAGANGSANIKNYSITIHSWEWTYDTQYQEWHYNFPCSDNSNSAVIGYVMSGNGKQALPYVETTSNWRTTMADDLFQSSPYIQFQFTNFTSTTSPPSYDFYFYLVVIPPAMKKPGVNYHNYEEVKKAHNL